jgi:hypothetical protein
VLLAAVVLTVNVSVCVEAPGKVTGFPEPPPLQVGSYVTDAPEGELVSAQVTVTVPA